MSASSINRSLATVKTELEFLQESDVISQEAFRDIMAALPERYSAPAPAEVRRETPSATHNEFVEAVYAFQAQQDGDLDFRAGDKIEVLEKPSPEWFRGKCNGRVGMFPSNYVKPAFSGSGGQETERMSMLPPAPPQYQSQQQLQLQPQQTNTSAQSNYSQPPFPPPSTNYYQNPPQQQAYYQSPPPQQQQPMPVQEQQQQQQHHMGGQAFKKFGSKLGNAAIFGAGATIGSDIVNGIF
ncbi:LAFA_0D02234g1_1 [Lachancea sp. 'fantastica']|nr:LAFA_0D02234g1_1 [Lachancea sp. 'fantastica']